MNDPSNPRAGPVNCAPLTAGVVPERENDYWKHCYRSRPYVEATDTYDDFGPAYAYGLQLFRTGTAPVSSDVQCDLAEDWNASRGESSLRWDRAKHAAYDVWERLSHRFSHESDVRESSATAAK